MDLHPNASIDTLTADASESDDTPTPHRIATDRLVLHRAHPDEIAFDRLHRLFADVDDGEVFELCGWESHEDEAETRAYLDRQTKL